ncbi:MAG: GNAT family N-acetyltransferase [Ruminococcus sp.]|nr:GNAT family N-acetyltransferase [Ruminococcus sp.]
MEIRRFREEDAEAVSALVIKTLRISNVKDYTPELMEEVVKNMQPANILERAGWTHFYVVEDEGGIIGCGAIGPYWGKTDESSLFTIFVLPEYQGRGAGRLIIETLEQDEFFLRAKRIEIPSSITAVNFYRRMGYDYKNGIAEVDDEHVYRLEKFR